MKSLKMNSRKIEVLLYVLIWTFVFSVPYFNERISDRFNWNEIIKNWIHVFGYLIIFLTNVYFLVPRLLFKKRYLNYFVLVSAITFLVIAVKLITIPGFSPPNISQLDGIRQPEINLHEQKSPFLAFADNIIICILIVGSGTTIRLMSKWLNEEKLRKDIEKEQLKTNLALLRHQVSPHFFMNTLNNIHALIELDSEKAQNAIERLSTLMRYLLYDSAQNKIELKKEIEFLNSFISLMQLRHSDEVEVTISIPEQIPEAKIPPMLFISLLENAFKHGVNYPIKSYIYFELTIIENTIICIIKNSKHKKNSKNQDEYSGLGLSNIKESLKLIYGDQFQLNILDKENEFEVNLKILL